MRRFNLFYNIGVRAAGCVLAMAMCVMSATNPAASITIVLDYHEEEGEPPPGILTAPGSRRTSKLPRISGKSYCTRLQNSTTSPIPGKPTLTRSGLTHSVKLLSQSK